MHRVTPPEGATKGLAYSRPAYQSGLMEQPLDIAIRLSALVPLGRYTTQGNCTLVCRVSFVGRNGNKPIAFCVGIFSRVRRNGDMTDALWFIDGVWSKRPTTSYPYPGMSRRLTRKDQQRAFRTIVVQFTTVRRCNNNTYALWFIGCFRSGGTETSHPYSYPSTRAAWKAQQQGNRIPDLPAAPVCWKSNKLSALLCSVTPRGRYSNETSRYPTGPLLWFSGRATSHPHPNTFGRSTRKAQQQDHLIPDRPLVPIRWNCNEPFIFLSFDPCSLEGTATRQSYS